MYNKVNANNPYECIRVFNAEGENSRSKHWFAWVDEAGCCSWLFTNNQPTSCKNA
jgi:hypothetical protein